MANEAVILELYGQPSGEPITFSVADAATIEKGTLMALSGADLYAVASSADGDIFAGIAATEKVGGDGSTTLGCYTKGIFDLKTDTGTIVLGDRVKLSGANLIAPADDDVAEHASQAFGTALETGAASEVIRVWVH